MVEKEGCWVKSPGKEGCESYQLCAGSPLSAKTQQPVMASSGGSTWVKVSQSCGSGTFWRLLGIISVRLELDTTLCLAWVSASAQS